jgi:hypothetical protein
MRTTYTIDLPPMPEAFHEAVKALLTREKYKETHYANPETGADETVWKFSNIMLLPRYIKLEYTPTQLIISGWMEGKSSLFAKKKPEWSLDGSPLTYGYGVKESNRRVIEKIIALAEKGRQIK